MADLVDRITVNPDIFSGKPIIRGRRLAVEHVLAMLAAGDSVEDILEGYDWLDREDVLACLEYARGSAAQLLEILKNPEKWKKISEYLP